MPRPFLPIVLALSLLTPIRQFFHDFSESFHTTTVERVMQSVVRVTGTQPTGDYICTGFVVAEGEELSAAHCLGTDITVDGVPATVVFKDKYYDLMLLRAHTTRKPVTFRDTPVLRLEKLVSIGYADGWTTLAQLPHSVVVSNYNPGGGASVVIVTPGYIDGMSGGPVIDGDGNVVAVVQRTSKNSLLGLGVGVLDIRAFLRDATGQ